MSVLVSSKTKWACDAKNCDNESLPEHDQIEANKMAEAQGWIKNPSTGKTYCPNCKYTNN